MNKRNLLLLLFILCIKSVWSQVGVNTESPEASLHVDAKNSDGLILENLPKTSDPAHSKDNGEPEYSNLQISKTGVVRVKENVPTFGNYFLDPEYGDIDLMPSLAKKNMAYTLNQQINVPENKYLYWIDDLGNSIDKYIILPEDGVYYFSLDMKGPVFFDRNYDTFPTPTEVSNDKTNTISDKIGATYGKSDKHIARIQLNDVEVKEVYLAPLSGTPAKISGQFVRQAEAYITASFLLEGKKNDKVSFHVVYVRDLLTGVENGGNNLAWTLRANKLNPNISTNVFFYKVN